MPNDFCPVKGRKADDTECGSIIFNATDAILAVCQTCERGVALIGTVYSRRVAASAAQPTNAQAANAQQGPAKTAWQMVVEATGHTSQGRLADALGTNQTKISQMFQKLGKGRLPSGQVWDDLLQLSGFSAETLFFAATGKPLSSAKAMPPVAPVASSFPKPSGPAVPPAGPEGSATEGEAASEGLGSQDAYDAAGLAMGLDVASLPPLSQHLLDVAQNEAEKAAEAIAPAIPPDFVLYRGPVDKPGLAFTKDGEISINSAAVRAFGLEGVERIRLYWSAKRNQVGIQPSPKGLKMQPHRHSMSRIVTARAFLREFGLSPAKGPHPISLDPSGLIVATISQQPSQGGEA